MAVEILAPQQTQQLEAGTQVTDKIATTVGQTVFELLAKPVEAQTPSRPTRTNTMDTTHSRTGYNPFNTDHDDEVPDAVADD